MKPLEKKLVLCYTNMKYTYFQEKGSEPLVRILTVDAGSRAAKAGLRAGDVLVSIGGHEIEDVLDYRFYLADSLVILACERDGKPFTVTIRKGEYDDIGLGFDTPLMDKKHSCRNGCVFCFIDQLPKGLRESLYFKDDDARLSFLHGNYITLTNLRDKDIDRIIGMHISPINVSVHTTNPELRVEMMKNKRAGEVLSYLDRLAAAGIRICAQIVLCKGINDGVELERSLRDLAKLAPALSSVSVVPAGLTRFRDGLYPLDPFTPEEARAVIGQVNAFGEACLAECGTRLFYCADELYLKAGLPIPAADYYEEYSQIENGVGMLRSLMDEFEDEIAYIEELGAESHPKTERTVSLATGAAAYDTMCRLARLLETKIPRLHIHVYRIINRFFGESITVAGLLTGHDLAEQLQDKPLGEALLLSSDTLRADGDLFLCGMTREELSEKLRVPLSFCSSDGRELVAALLGQPL